MKYLLIILATLTLVSLNACVPPSKEPVVEEQTIGEDRHLGDQIADGLKDCDEAHTILARFPDGHTATLDLPPWSVMILLATESGSQTNPEAVVREYIKGMIDDAQNAGAVAFGVVHTDAYESSQDRTPDKHA